MQKEIDLLVNYPKSKRNLEERVSEKSEETRKVARQFGKDFFDGDRNFGYGGFNYNPRFWKDVIPDFVNKYQLTDNSKILDVGCAKGFMLYDFLNFNPKFQVYGIDISEYAISNSKEEVKDCLKVGSATKLDYPDNYFDLVISINTVHNLEKNYCGIALKEIQRVTKFNSYITVDAFSNDEEEKRMYEWNLTAKTIMSTKDWKDFFREIKYEGDYFWFIP